MKAALTLARKICTKDEAALVRRSYPPAISTLPEKELKALLSRARSLRKKNKDLLRTQRLATRKAQGAKDGVAVAANKRTEDKIHLFDGAVGRLEEKLKSLGADSASATAGRKRPTARSAKKAAVRKKKAAKKAVRKAGGSKAATSAAPAPADARPKASRTAPSPGKKAGGRAKAEASRGSAPGQAEAAPPPRTGSGLVVPKQPGQSRTQFQSPRAKSAQVRVVEANTRRAALRGIVGARGRKNQAKRDSK